MYDLYSQTDNNGSITFLYNILNNEKETFFVSPEGMLILSRPLDREVTPKYEITIVARTRVHPFTSARIIVTIEVEDVRDNYPVFSTMPIISIPESHVINSHIVTAQATSLDTFLLFYSIVGGCGHNSFSIDFETGSINLTRSLNFIKQSSHTIIVRATNGQLSSETTVTVNVQDVPLPPLFTKTVYNFIISSNVATGHVIGGVYSNDGDLECGIPIQNTGLIYTTNSVSI